MNNLKQNTNLKRTGLKGLLTKRYTKGLLLVCLFYQSTSANNNN
jgi:hypothetical protein